MNTMRVVRFVPILLPLIFVSATCVTDIRRHGDTGPWVGEVTNYGSDTIGSVYVSGHIIDAAGRELGTWSVNTCPSQLAPGERGTFEIFSPEVYTPEGQPPPTPPFEFVPDPGVQGYPVDVQYPGDPYNSFTGVGLTTRLVSKDAARRFALVELTNDSPFTYQNITVCGNLRTPSGTLAEVGSTTPFPNTLHPGEKQTFPIFFNAMPEGTFEFFPRGANYCCGNIVTLPSDSFVVTAMKTVDHGTALRVVGEMHQQSGQTLNGTALSAHVQGSWADRADTQVVGCNGVTASGQATPGSFTLPLSPGAHNPAVAVEGVAGYYGSTSYAPPVSDVTAVGGPPSPDGLATKRVSATISNPTPAWISLEGVCLSLRDARGRLVGAASALENVQYNDRYLAPGAQIRISGDVEELEPSATAEAVAYGQPTAPPPPPVPCCGPID